MSPESTSFTAADVSILERVEPYLDRGLALKRWWDRNQRRGGRFEERFELAFTFNRPDFSYGFFDRAPVGGGLLPVMGNYQEQFYDQPKSETSDRRRAAAGIDAELRPFVLRYFMRVSDFRDPQPYTDDRHEVPELLRPFSLCTGRDVRRIGFGFQQLYYKRAANGRIGKFPENRQHAIVDLRDIGPRFEWVVLRVKIFDFNFQLQPFGGSGPTLTIPSDENSLLVVSRPFICDQSRPRPGVLGRYGFGYAFIKNPEQTALAWGPGKFDAAFQTIHFEVLDDGRIRVEMVFVANRPTAIALVSLDPLQWGCAFANAATGGAARPFTAPFSALAQAMPWGQLTFDPVFSFVALANLATAGLAAQELCISRQQIEKQLILIHFQKHYAAISGSLQTWRQIRDWDDESSLPGWVLRGASA